MMYVKQRLCNGAVPTLFRPQAIAICGQLQLLFKAYPNLECQHWAHVSAELVPELSSYQGMAYHHDPANWNGMNGTKTQNRISGS